MSGKMKPGADPQRVRGMPFSAVYPLYVKKAERKGRSKEDVDSIIFWLTGYDAESLKDRLEREVDFEAFFAQAPRMNPLASKVTGVICGYRVEEIEDGILRDARRLDKLIDELAKGRPMEKILRS